jgi:hypothetical protein
VWMRRVLVLLVAASLDAAGCGHGAHAKDAAQPRASSTPIPGADVVRAWSDALRHGDVDAATGRFGVPAVVANGSPEIRLTTRAQVRAFNSSLSCGSRVTDVVPHAGLLIVTFELTDRPGGNCGDGVGHSAKVALQVRKGRIVRWLRLPTEGAAPSDAVPA